MSPTNQAAVLSDTSFRDWVRAQVEAEQYWFHKIELAPGIITHGWSDPKKDKLPHYGLPSDLTGKRVLDVGCAEGFFSFESERRGASEVVAIDSFPDSVRRFNICRDALSSKATAYLANVYELNPRTFGTFDLVMFYGVLYHLRHPLLALEKILSVCTGTMLMQTATYENPHDTVTPVAQFNPFGMPSGPDKTIFDPTVFWRPNGECVKAMMASVGFKNVKVLSTDPLISIVVSGESPIKAQGKRPDESKAPWS